MSTKTTFKRIALGTVAALGFGLLTVTPSSATSQSDTLTIGSATTTVSAGSTFTIDSTILTNTITQSFLGVQSDTMGVTITRTSAPTGSINMAKINITNAAATARLATGSLSGTPVISSDELTGFVADTGAAGTYKLVAPVYGLTFVPDKYGTYVFTMTAYNFASSTSATQTRSAIPAVASAVTWTIVVDQPAAADSASHSLIIAGTSVSTGSADASANTLRFAAGTTHIATIKVTPLTTNSAGAGIATTGSTTTVAVVTGPGSISAGASATGARTLTQALAPGVHTINVFGDGTTGTTTITITMGTLTFTETVYFYGAASVVTTTTINSVVDSGSGVSSNVLFATVKDANGNVRPGTTVYAVSGTTTVFANASAVTGSNGIATIALTGKGTAGTSAITAQLVAAGSTTTTTSAAAVSIRAGDPLADSVTMTLDKASYTPGEAMLLTLTIKDAAGNLVAPGTHEVLSTTLKSTRALSVADTMPGASIVTTGSTGLVTGSLTVSRAGYGVVTYALSAPNTSGDFTLSATAGADNASAGSTLSITATVGKSANEIAVDAAIAAATAAGVAATAAATAAGTAAVAAATAAGAAATAAAEAATDAATEAIDAANAATDSANAAAEAADAATAAAQQAGEDAVAASEAAQAAAVDAAAEATEAANAATDAANAAAESADAATAAAQDASDAVAALSTQVATLISGLKAQLTALTNLVIKIQKKVKA